MAVALAMCFSRIAGRWCHRDLSGSDSYTIENAAGMATAEQMQQSIFVAQQMFISEVITAADWSARISGG